VTTIVRRHTAPATMETWEARVAALSRAVRAHPTSPYRRLRAADCKRAMAARVAQGELILDSIE
jgi:hypothetical protein